MELGGLEPAAGPIVERPPAPSVERDEARLDEKRVGLAIPGLTQRRSAFAALTGALPHPEEVSEPSTRPRPNSPASEAERDVPSVPARTGVAGVASLPALRSADFALTSPPPRPNEQAAFQARTRIVEEVEHVRRAVAAQDARVTPEMVRAVAREVVREAAREGGTNARAEASPPRRTEPLPAPVVVVQQRTAVVERVPRAFWSSSALRSTHLRMLR